MYIRYQLVWMVVLDEWLVHLVPGQWPVIEQLVPFPVLNGCMYNHRPCSFIITLFSCQSLSAKVHWRLLFLKIFLSFI